MSRWRKRFGEEGAEHLLAQTIAVAKQAKVVKPSELKRVNVDTTRFITRGERTPTGKLLFDQLCQQLNIEHRSTSVRRAQTYGMVERFNVSIADILKTHRLVSGESLDLTIIGYVNL